MREITSFIIKPVDDPYDYSRDWHFAGWVDDPNDTDGGSCLDIELCGESFCEFFGLKVEELEGRLKQIQVKLYVEEPDDICGHGWPLSFLREGSALWVAPDHIDYAGFDSAGFSLYHPTGHALWSHLRLVPQFCYGEPCHVWAELRLEKYPS